MLQLFIAQMHCFGFWQHIGAQYLLWLCAKGSFLVGTGIEPLSAICNAYTLVLY